MNENIIFCRILLKLIKPEVEAAGYKVNKDAWVWNSGHGDVWEFHIPSIEYFNGAIQADNAYDARYQGWSQFLKWGQE